MCSLKYIIMDKIKGLISLSLHDAGSKSEGRVSQLRTSDGNVYTLYREDSMPQDDPFFEQFKDMEVTVNGDAEEGNGYICVQSVEYAGGIVSVPQAKVVSSPIIFLDDAPASEPVVVARPKRLPRKLKKKLKKSNKL